MNDRAKITARHFARQAIVYLRQSSPAQVEHNRESTQRQYALANRACELGWSNEHIVVIDEDLGLSGSGSVARSGFVRLTTEVALGRVSRLAGNNADWHRLIDLAGLTDTLIGDADGIYHPALFNDRLLLGLKGTMSEAELHVLRARLNGGIRNKAERGELRRGLPVGFVWGEVDGEVLQHPDEAVVTAIRSIFMRFAETGSARRVWLWLRDQGYQLPLQMSAHAEIRWVAASYHAVHQVLTNPVYAGAYVYGKTRSQMTLDAAGSRRKRIKLLPRDHWQVLIKEHHEGFIDWPTYEANQRRIARNTRPGPHKTSGAVREGSALLQGLASCGRCGRRLRTHYRGRNSAPGYHCAVDPDNRLVARGLERAWEQSLTALEAAKAELSRREQERPRVLSTEERDHLSTLGRNLAAVWTAATTTPRDRKELLGSLIEEVIVKVERDKSAAHLTLRWKGGALTEIDLDLPRSRPVSIRTDEDTVALVRRLAVHYPDTVIAGILNRQGRRTARGHRFEGNRVCNLRQHWKIPCFVPNVDTAAGELLTIKRAAIELGVAPSTIHRLINDGIIGGEQVTPGAPWRIRLTDDLKARFNAEPGEGFLPMREAIRALGVSRQTVLQRAKRGELEAVHVTRGRQKGLRIKVMTPQSELFERAS